MEISEAIFNFIFDMAMKDAISQRAFGTKGEEKRWLCDTALMNEVTNKLKRHVELVKDGKIANKDEYNNFFDELCSDICEIINNLMIEKSINCKSTFTYGNAQKLVNMTLKYYFIAYYDSDIKENFQCCHCPMDGKMIKLVVDEAYQNGVNISNELKYVSWSKITINGKGKESKDMYYSFQNAVSRLARNEGSIPLEYDFKHWGE